MPQLTDSDKYIVSRYGWDALPQEEPEDIELLNALPGQEGGFYFKCGLHWLGITFGIGGIILNVHSADADMAICFDTYQEAAAIQKLLAKRSPKTPYDLVKVR